MTRTQTTNRQITDQHVRPLSKTLLGKASHHALLASVITFAVIGQSASADVISPPALTPQFSESGPSAAPYVTLDDAQSGSLLLKTETFGQYINAPMVDTDVVMDIAGPVIRTTVSQVFENTTEGWVEGTYVFPLPDDAAVDHLRMVIGGRIIEGEIKEKKQAKKIYEQAKSEGKKASLVEQQRPNIFTASVANIGPYEKVAIQIEYQAKASVKNGKFSARFPTTVGARYSPPAQVVDVATTDGRQSFVLDPVLDRHAISPPIMPPKLEPVEYLRLPVSMSVNLDAGFDLNDVSSPYHNIQVTPHDEDSVTVNLSEGAMPANRDFVLEWDAVPSAVPYSAAFKQTIGQDTYVLSMLTPPKASYDHAEPVAGFGREAIFVIDTSGSMGGASIEQARESLLLALDQLQPQDTFNIIRFSSNYSKFSTQPLNVTPSSLERARRWVNGLKAGGGTEMSSALAQATKPRFVSLKSEGIRAERIRQIIFITDGAIGNERQLFAQIQDDLGEARLFPVGIGSAPNSYFMSRAAKFGRGTYVQIGKPDEVAQRMSELWSAISNPVLKDLTSDLGGETYPSRLPDVYDGDIVISISKLSKQKAPETLSLSGTMVGQDWSAAQDLSLAQEATGLSVLWARAKIADLEERRFDRNTLQSLDEQILKTALEHHIVSRLTSLVAVDKTPARPISAPLNGLDVPTMLPDGWDFAKLVAPSPRGLSSGRAQSGGAKLNAPVQSLALPSTASPHQILAILGSLLILLGLSVSRIFRSRFGRAGL